MSGRKVVIAVLTVIAVVVFLFSAFLARYAR